MTDGQSGGGRRRSTDWTDSDSEAVLLVPGWLLSPVRTIEGKNIEKIFNRTHITSFKDT